MDVLQSNRLRKEINRLLEYIGILNIYLNLTIEKNWS